MRTRRHHLASLLPDDCVVLVHERNLSLVDSARARLEEALDHLESATDFDDPNVVDWRADRREIMVGTTLKSPVVIAGDGLEGSGIEPRAVHDHGALLALASTVRHLFDRRPVSHWPEQAIAWHLRRRSLLGQYQADELVGEALATPWRPGGPAARSLNARRGVADEPYVTDEEAGSVGRPVVLQVAIRDFGWRIEIERASMYRIGDIDVLTAMRSISSGGPDQ